jgi:hypothetical protein
MPVTVECTCGQQFIADDVLCGQQVPCPSCRATIDVPVLLQPAPPRAAKPPEPEAETELPSTPLQDITFNPQPYYALPRPKPAAPVDENLVLRVAIISGIVTLLFAVVIVVLSYRSSSSTLVQNEQPELDESDAVPPAVPIVVTRPSDAESRAAATRFVDAVIKRRAALAVGMVDSELLLRRARFELDIAESELQHVDPAFIRRILDREIRRRMISLTVGHGSYELVRMEATESGLTALTRVAGQQPVVDYQRIEFSQRDSEARVADIYFYSSGESLTRILRREQILSCSESRESLIRRLRGWDRAVVQLAPEFTGLVENVDLDPQVSLEAFAQLPATVQSEPSLLFMRIEAAQQVSPSEYRRAVKDFEEHHRDDAGLQIVKVNHHYRLGQFHLAMRPLDRLEALIGRDRYLDIVRGFACLGLGRHEDAKKYAKPAVAQGPGKRAAHLLMLQVSLAEEDHESTLEWLTAMRELFAIQRVDVRELPGYADFVGSPQYAEWKIILETDAPR